MDMWEPYVSVTTQYVPEAQEKIAFDKFHVAGHLGDAVDRVRHAEPRRPAGADDQRLKGSRYRRLTNPENMDKERCEQFAELRDSALQTARAWGYKEHAMTLWAYRSRAWARKGWEGSYRSAIRCRLEPVKKVARMIKRHLDGILTAVVDRVTNARAESINAEIQKPKYSARGFRNAIYFHLAVSISTPPASPRDPLFPPGFLKTRKSYGKPQPYSRPDQPATNYRSKLALRLALSSCPIALPAAYQPRPTLANSSPMLSVYRARPPTHKVTHTFAPSAPTIPISRISTPSRHPLCHPFIIHN